MIDGIMLGKLIAKLGVALGLDGSLRAGPDGKPTLS
jgi:hypothetical protein